MRSVFILVSKLINLIILWKVFLISMRFNITDLTPFELIRAPIKIAYNNEVAIDKDAIMNV